MWAVTETVKIKFCFFKLSLRLLLFSPNSDQLLDRFLQSAFVYCVCSRQLGVCDFLKHALTQCVCVCDMLVGKHSPPGSPSALLLLSYFQLMCLSHTPSDTDCTVCRWRGKTDLRSGDQEQCVCVCCCGGGEHTHTHTHRTMMAVKTLDWWLCLLSGTVLQRNGSDPRASDPRWVSTTSFSSTSSSSTSSSSSFHTTMVCGSWL